MLPIHNTEHTTVDMKLRVILLFAALCAASSGAMLGFGYALLHNDRFKTARDVARTTSAAAS